MTRIEKQLRAIPGPYRERVFSALERIIARDFAGLDRLQLKRHECIYRVRVGHYRIIYFDDGQNIAFQAIRRRNEATYRDF